MLRHHHQVLGYLRTATMEVIDHGQHFALGNGRKRNPAPHQAGDLVSGPVVGGIGQANVQSTFRHLARHHAQRAMGWRRGRYLDALGPGSRRQKPLTEFTHNGRLMNFTDG